MKQSKQTDQALDYGARIRAKVDAAITKNPRPDYEPIDRSPTKAPERHVYDEPKHQRRRESRAKRTDFVQTELWPAMTPATMWDRLDGGHLNVAAIRAYHVLRGRFGMRVDNAAYPSQATIARNIKRSRQRTNEALRMLEADGWITIERTGRSHRYFDVPWLQVPNRRMERRAIAPTCPEVGTSDVPDRGHNKQKVDKQIPLNPQ
ncbi:MAG: hypothetical protein F4X02_12590 [Chloroflexi bacterium]|nr:hypothetical protein [Chloroflexota bacterium]